MIRKRVIFLGAFMLVALLSFSSVALAWNIGDPLVPCGRNVDNPGTTGEGSCTVCHLYVLGQNIVDFLTKLAAPLIALLAIAIGGFKILISGDQPGLRSDGMRIIKDTVIGLIIVFAAWVIINELLLFFAKPSTTPSVESGQPRQNAVPLPWNQIQCP